MENEVLLRLPRNAVGQILEGLQERRETWENTVNHLEAAGLVAPYFVEDCSDPDEARSIAGFYKQIIESIETQIALASDTDSSDEKE